jgi:hypothetical protein
MVADIDAPIRAYMLVFVIMPVVVAVVMPMAFMLVVMAMFVVPMVMAVAVVSVALMLMPMLVVMAVFVVMVVPMFVVSMFVSVAVVSVVMPVLFACIAHSKHPPGIGIKGYHKRSKNYTPIQNTILIGVLSKKYVSGTVTTQGAQGDTMALQAPLLGINYTGEGQR